MIQQDVAQRSVTKHQSCDMLLRRVPSIVDPACATRTWFCSISLFELLPEFGHFTIKQHMVGSTCRPSKTGSHQRRNIRQRRGGHPGFQMLGRPPTSVARSSQRIHKKAKSSRYLFTASELCCHRRRASEFSSQTRLSGKPCRSDDYP